MSELKTSLENLAADLRAYADARLALMKLKAAEKISGLAGRFIAGLVLLVSLILFFSFVSVGLALLLGEWLGRPWLGFVLLGGLFLIIGLLIWWVRRPLIQRPVMNSMIQELFHDNDYEKDQHDAAAKN
ncbi:MAG: phage holin family protein [Chitinophagaceae bacterium]